MYSKEPRAVKTILTFYRQHGVLPTYVNAIEYDTRVKSKSAINRAYRHLHDIDVIGKVGNQWVVTNPIYFQAKR